MMVRGKRHNHVVQFKGVYPKTGGGEDIDFVFQMKEFYFSRPGSRLHASNSMVVSVPGAIASHPWWNAGNLCYSQIAGWAWGDSLCLTEWPAKTFLVFPNWVEVATLLIMVGLVTNIHFHLGKDPVIPPIDFISTVKAVAVMATIDHCSKFASFYAEAKAISRRSRKGSLHAAAVALGASSVISAQELTRVWAMLRRTSPYSFSRRMDWFDGQTPTEVLDIQLRSGIMFAMYCFVLYYFVF